MSQEKLELVAIISQLVIFSSYVFSSLIRFGLTDSISASYYEQKTWIGRLWFTFTLIGIGFLLYAFMEGDTSWNALLFFGGAGVILTGIAAEYKKSYVEKYHVYGIIIGIILVLVAIWILFGLWWPTIAVITTILITHGFKVRGATWFVEVSAFYSIVLGLLFK